MGKVLSGNGVLTASNIDAINKWPVPKNKFELCSFLGLSSYHMDTIANFARMAGCLSGISGSKV